MLKTIVAKLISIFTNNPHGFITPEVKPEDWHFGAIGGDIVRSDGQWLEFLPTVEDQKKRIETMNCTSFGTLNAIEALHKTLYGEEPNYSDRYCGILAGTTVRGNSVEKPCETMRHKPRDASRDYSRRPEQGCLNGCV